MPFNLPLQQPGLFSARHGLLETSGVWTVHGLLEEIVDESPFLQITVPNRSTVVGTAQVRGNTETINQYIIMSRGEIPVLPIPLAKYYVTKRDQ